MSSRKNDVSSRLKTLVNLSIVVGAVLMLFQSACGSAPMPEGEDIDNTSSGITVTFPRFPDDMAPVEIKNFYSNKCLDIPGGTTAPGTVAEQYTCNGGRNQEFFQILTETGTNSGYQLLTAHVGNRYLGMQGNSASSGALLEMRAGDPRIFQLNLQGDGSYTIVAKDSGKCLDMPGFSTANSVKVQQWDCNGGANQKWWITPRNVGMNLIAKHSKRCLDVSWESTASGIPIQQFDCYKQANQQWRTGTKTVAGISTYYEVIANHSGLCMEVVGASTAANAKIQQATCNGGDHQKWKFMEGWDGFVIIENKLSQKCLDIAAASTANHVLLEQYHCTGNENQRFWWGPVETRHARVYQVARQNGADRALQNDTAFSAQVAQLNSVYNRYGLKILYDIPADKINIDSDALFNVEFNPNGNYTCPDGTPNKKPEECALAVANTYPNNLVIFSNPANSGWTSAATPYIVFGISSNALQCSGTVPDTKWLAHEYGHYMGLLHPDADLLQDTRPDPGGDWCTAPNSPTGVVNGVTVDTNNAMTYYYNSTPVITPMQGSMVRATAYARGY